MTLSRVARPYLGVGSGHARLRSTCQSHSCVSAGEVIFDRNHPDRPPDIIFSSEDDFMEFDPDIEQLKVDR